MTGFNVKVCEDNEIEPCYPVYATILGALLEQFWTIFGYGYTVEPPQALKTPDEAVSILFPQNYLKSGSIQARG